MSKERHPVPQTPPTETPVSEPAVTLEGLALRVEQLADAVLHFSQIAPPPDARPEAPSNPPHGEEVLPMTEEQNDSIIVKAGSKTYFFDLKQTRDNKPYLLLTESRFKGEGEERERVSITIFPESAGLFGQAVAEMVDRLSEPAPDRQ